MGKIQIVTCVLAVLQVVLPAPQSTENPYSPENPPILETPNTTEKPTLSSLDKVLERVKVSYNDVILALDKQFPNTKEVSDKFIEQSRKFIKDVEVLMDKVKVQMDKNQEQFNAVLAKVSDKLSEHLGKLKEIIGPNASAKVDQVKDRLERSFKVVYDSVKSVVDAAKPGELYNTADKFFDFTMQFVDKFIDTAQVMQKSLESTLVEARRTMTRMF